MYSTEPAPENVPDGATNCSLGGVPRILAPSTLEKLRQVFFDEYAPIGPTELVLVAELARHAAGMERWTEAALAVERCGVRALPLLTTAVTEQSFSDSVLASAMSTDAANLSERHTLLRSRAFLRTLEKLEAVQAGRRERERRGATMPPLDFADEAACECYLADRLRCGEVSCPKCGEIQGCVIPTRKCWECRNCKTQVGLRTNTVMARSPVPLRQWFDAIRWLLWRPTIGTTELAEKIGLARIATVRSMMAKIRTAMASEDASECLAGLDLRFARVSST